MTLKLRAPVPFPANVTGAGGITVSKEAGIWTIEPDFASIDAISATVVSDPTSKQIWIYDPVTLTYNVLTLAALGDALYSATSTTSLAIGLGSKAFTTQSGKDFAVGSWVIAYSAATPANFMAGQVTAYATTTLTVSVSSIGGTGTAADWVIRASSPPGASRSGFSYSWLTAVTNTDPGSGKIKANNATFASITSIYISETDYDGNALAALIATWVTGTSTIKGRLKFSDPFTPTNFMTFDVTALTDNGTWDTLTVTPVASGGTFTAAELLQVSFTPKGDKGDTGPAGAVTSIAANVGAFTLGAGVTNSTNVILSDPTYYPGFIGGLTLSNDGGTPNTVLDIAAGAAVSDDYSTLMKIAAFTKNCNAAWAVGTGNGALDTGSALAANSSYGVYIITRPDTGVVDILVSKQAAGGTAVTMPTNYTKKRYIGSIRTDGSSHIYAFTQNGNYFIYATPIADLSITNAGAAAVTRALTVPLGYKTKAFGTVVVTSGSGTNYLLLSDLATADQAPGTVGGQANGVFSTFLGVGSFDVMMNLSGQFRTRQNGSNASDNFTVNTQGWFDTTRGGV